MPPISYDGQSFSIAGQRVWLVSGEMHYARTPRELWRSRIQAAKQAGLNCISTYVFWNLHEPAPGKFNFEGDADLRHFVELIAEEEMYCILRPGPYVCSEWDFGGLPAWLHDVDDIKLREANGPFLEATSRYFAAMLDQVKDLQVNSRGGGRTGGPIVLMQAENEWMCHHPVQAAGYLGELVRYLRESGCTVPVLTGNNLWAQVEDTIDTWNANEHLTADLRQLRVIQPDAPRLMTEYWGGWFDVWGRKRQSPTSADRLETNLVQILAAGAQYNIYMFHGGTNFGFTAGLSGATRDGYVSTSYDSDAPLGEAGARGDKYIATKRISMFANHFGYVLAHLKPEDQHAAIASGKSPSVIHHRGTQGDVIFVLTEGDADQVDVLLPDGQTLPVPMTGERVAWFVLDANLNGTATLTYTNLRPWALIGERMLVLFGPAGAEGIVCIDDAPVAIKVPTCSEPAIAHHEDFTIVVLNREQVDAAHVTDDTLELPALSIDVDGNTTTKRKQVAKRQAAPKLNAWAHAIADAEFEPIDGPQRLGDFGYGWYRLKLQSKVRGKLLAPRAADRLHLFSDGSPVALLGRGPGATNDPVSVDLAGEITVLADNLGRSCFGWTFGESKGLYGDLYLVTPAKLTKPKVVADLAPDLFQLGGYFTRATLGERIAADTLVWEVDGKGHAAMVFDIDGLDVTAMLLVNDVPIGVYHPELTGGLARFTLVAGETLKRGRNVLKLALFDTFQPKKHDLNAIRLFKAKTPDRVRAEWSRAPWSPPTEFGEIPKQAAPGPCWYQANFAVRHTDQPLWLEPAGMTKGQIYLNGHNVGRYFIATADGKTVEPQKRYYLPEPWLRTDEPNELLLFDEHGKRPTRCKLAYGP